MSLSPQQQRRTSEEIQANATAAGLSREEFRHRTGLSSSRFDAAFHVTAGDPADVWLLRDIAETAAREAGETVTSYSVLTESARRQAAGWFGVDDHR